MFARLSKLILNTIFFVLAIIFIAKNAGPALLKFYVRQGIGQVENHQIFSLAPEKEIVAFSPDRDFIAGLTRFRFAKIEISLPKDFKVVAEQSEKFYYKKRPWAAKGGVAFLVSESPGYFLKLFPELKAKGIKSDYEFIKHVLSAKYEQISNLDDAFFVVLKSLFTPDLGKGEGIKIIEFVVKDKKGFIAYNLTPEGYFFDCNVFDKEGNYFAVYIRDVRRKLNLENVASIVSTLERL